jgi:AGZA family xanthine/uracil permease-like MFS transporter
MNENNTYPWIVKRDIDGFFGLAIDNLIQFLLIASLCPVIAGIPAEFVFTRILPGAALSLVFGNLFYSWQARKLARHEKRRDVTALPYGINTVSLFAYLIFIMGPVYRETGSYEIAWKVGLLACFLSGVIEFGSALFMDKLRRITPRAALLSSLAGIAITFISMDFALKTFEHPLIAMLPLAIILIQYFSKVRFPFGLPGGMVALIAGTILAWVFGIMDFGNVGRAVSRVGFNEPKFTGAELMEVIKSPYLYKYLSIIIPMALFNVFGSVQNLESAEAAGDRYETKPALAMNGIGSLIASLFGSCFPTTIYIGHPGWKGLGARTGYSVLNGIFFLIITLAGCIGLINSIIPMEAGIAIVLWIGITIAAQAFQATPRSHAPAVVIGLFPAFAAWGVNILKQSYMGVGTTLAKQALSGIPINGVMGLMALEKGFIFSSMILAAISVFLIEKDFLKASLWSLAGMILAFFGVIHTFKFVGNETVSVLGFNAGGKFAFGYLCFAVVFLSFYFYRKMWGEER